MSIMKRKFIVGLLYFVLLSTLACNLQAATGTGKMTPVRFDTSGDRRAFSGEYSCEVPDTVILIIDEDDVAMLSTTGPVFVDYINCTLDPSGFQATYTIVGLADPDSKLVTFTSCNEGAFTAEGTISYQSGKPVGNVSCTHSTGSEAGKIAIMLWVPSGNPAP
jgi:hypothetical protein